MLASRSRKVTEIVGQPPYCKVKYGKLWFQTLCHFGGQTTYFVIKFEGFVECCTLKEYSFTSCCKSFIACGLSVHAGNYGQDLLNCFHSREHKERKKGE